MRYTKQITQNNFYTQTQKEDTWCILPEKHIGIANWYRYLYDEKHNTFSSTHTIHVGKVTHLVTPSYTTASYVKVTSVHKYSDWPAVTT